VGIATKIENMTPSVLAFIKEYYKVK
jgi:hypothetical protein